MVSQNQIDELRKQAAVQQALGVNNAHGRGAKIEQQNQAKAQSREQFAKAASLTGQANALQIQLDQEILEKANTEPVQNTETKANTEAAATIQTQQGGASNELLILAGIVGLVFLG